ncbi:malto-oligosyltrehalose synthase [Thiocapsa sp. UBA6158]|jgi:(1->4)-alpha-D-glucan 1-alpha-D-glucosylmutase|uniref:malto-oligosyltrehalose synthase n=1 Tax=Thiocapsa sp. UBA6158 TaxID=1947692 RepID=UPI0025E8950A|nr:malto-oligosyltrehalose synthase [Thiocapsa sp. UBA6158]
MKHSDLAQLCTHYGVAVSYADRLGQPREVAPESLRALLRTLGIPAGDAATERVALRAALDRDWRRILQPVVALREGSREHWIDLSLPESVEPDTLQWVLREEDAGIREEALQTAPGQASSRRRLDNGSWIRRRVALPLPAGPGRHRLELHACADGALLAVTTLILAPRRAYEPASICRERRSWGLATSLEALRSGRNWGVGDFTDLTRLIELLAESGGGMLATPPLHPRADGRVHLCDPYFASSRQFINPLYIDVEAIVELAESPEARAQIAEEPFQARLRALRADPPGDPGAVARTKLDILRPLFRYFRRQHPNPDSPRAAAFLAFRNQAGEPLQRYCLFEAIAAGSIETAGARTDADEAHVSLPAAGSAEAATLARAHAEQIDFHAWLQWIAHRQLQGVGRRSLELHLALGLSPELAPGVAPQGADAWSEPELFVAAARLGACPGPQSPDGEDWGLLSWHPRALREAAYAPLVAVLRANMRDSGALRIRHLSTLLRPFLIPEGQQPEAGTYVALPQEEVLAVLALESRRNQCLLIDNDPDGAPESIREALADLGVLETRRLYGERDAHGGFLPPSQYPEQALVSASDPETPPLAGFWRGTDLEQQRSLGPAADKHVYEDLLVRRNNDRAHLLLALDREGLLTPEQSKDPLAVPELTPEHLRAVQVYLARAPSRLLLLQATDILGQTGPIRAGGRDVGSPEGPIRHKLAIDEWPDRPEIRTLFAAVRTARGAECATTPRDRPAAEHDTGRARSLAVIPRATYRLQLHGGFGFGAATRLVPYLDALGISHCYLSPIFKARPGSRHGYDVIAHDQINPELGSREDYERFCETLAEHGMSQILDVVPNHVGVMGSENRWWLDVLENGPASLYADYFDIDWEPLKAELRGKILVPVLGGHYGDILDSGELELVFAEGAFRIEYYEHRFPIDPREYPRILAMTTDLERLRERMGRDHGDLAAFESLMTAFGNLPSRDARDTEALSERRRDTQIHKQRLAELCSRHADLAWYVQECLRHFNGAEDYPPDPGRMHDLLQAQAYRLAHWRVAADDINYRRFFDINDLAALRMENPQALEATHALVLELIGNGRVTGLRIDHPDGLHDPAGYFRWLQQHSANAFAAGEDQPTETDLPLYLVAEKILTGDEELPPEWPLHGTTGYDFAALDDALMVDTRGAVPLSDCYRDFAGAIRPLADEVYAAKRLVMRNLLSSELQVLATELSRIAEADPHTRDFSQNALHDALTEITACFPVYRTYLTPGEVSDSDRHQVLKAVAEARRRSRAADLTVFGFVRDVLLTDIAEGKPAPLRERVLRLAMKFQQYTGPVMAKGLEDTAFYRHHRLVSLNEVGNDPGRFGIGIDAWHRANQKRLKSRPHAMLNGSTHDSKRSEDLRARLHVLSELPEEWRRHVTRWSRINRRLRRELDDRVLPDPGTEYLLYQTLLGVWPLEDPDEEALQQLCKRVRDYMLKAVKEAKIHTAWTNPDGDYEEALAAFIDALFERERSAVFFADFLPFQRRIARFGLFNSLSQTALRLTAPGVPDLYQGCELWNFSLADPDNRRPVDFTLRMALSDRLADAREEGAGLTRALAERIEDGRAKLFLIRQALTLRRADPELFALGDYRPLAVEGPHAERLCAFSRRLEDRAVMVVVPRLLAGLVPEPEAADTLQADPFDHPGWSSTWVEAPAPRLRDRLSGALQQTKTDRGRHLIPAAELVQRFPVGLLTSEDHDRA